MPSINCLWISGSPRDEGKSWKLIQSLTPFLPEFQHEILFPHQLNLHDCTGCEACSESGQCVYDSTDDGQRIRNLIRGADRLIMVSPIYFYHLPSSLKRMIDRSQPAFHAKKNSRSTSSGRGVCILYGESEGVRLFEGSLLTFRYFLDAYRISPYGDFLLRGIRSYPDMTCHVDALCDWLRRQIGE